MVINTIQFRRGRRKEEMVFDTLQPRRGRREEEMVVTTLPYPMLIPMDNDLLITTLPFPMLIPVDNDLKSLALSVITMLPFPMLIPVDDNDLKSLTLSVDVAGSKTLVALESAFLIGGDTAHTVDVSDLPHCYTVCLPQKSEGGVTGRTETASRSPSTTRL